MLRRAWFVPLLLAAGCAEPIDPGTTGDYRMRDAGSSGSNNNSTPEPEADTGELGGDAAPAEDSGSTTPPADSAAPDSVAPDSAAPDTATPDTGTPDTGKPDTGTPDTGTPDTGTPPVDSGTGTVITFPVSTDTFNILWDPNFWNLGDYIQGSRPTSLPSITSINGTIGIKNSLSACGALDLVVSVNGTSVGTVKITNASGAAVPLALTFPAKTGPTYVLRFQAGNTVKSGCGALTINEDSNKFTLK